MLLDQPNTEKKSKGGNPLEPSTYIKPSAFPTPSTPLSKPVTQRPALYSSSMVSQSDDPTDQMALVFPDWKVCLEVENSPEGAKALWDGALSGTLGRAGRLLQNEGEGVERRRSWVLPYRAIVLLCKSTRAIGSDSRLAQEPGQALPHRGGAAAPRPHRVSGAQRRDSRRGRHVACAA